MIIYPDLSQLEYRLIAHETREPKLIKAFNAGEDIHENLGIYLTGKRPKDKAERKIMKTGNYAGIYGAGFWRFANTTKMDPDKARPLWKKMENVYPSINEYKDELQANLEDNDPYKLTNIFGRVRYISLSEFYGDTMRERMGKAMRESFNWIFQSSGHDILKLWTMETLDMIDDPEVLFINDAHDEYVLDVPDKKAKSVLSTIEFVSANLNTLIRDAFGVKMRVPIIAEIDKGRTWK